LRDVAFLPEAHRNANAPPRYVSAGFAQNLILGGFKMIGVVVCLLAVLSFLGFSAAAQETPRVDIFAGYSYLRANPSTSGVDAFNLHGGSASFAYNAKNWLGLVGDFGGYHAGNISGSGVDGTMATYLFGPRLSYRKHERLTPFAQVLFGGAHGSASFLGASSSSNVFAMTAGGGLDAKLSNHFSARLVQAEYFLTRFQEATTGSSSQNNLRLSTGIVFHF
jgi:opacity protein-like surface antigen